MNNELYYLAYYKYKTLDLNINVIIDTLIVRSKVNWCRVFVRCLQLVHIRFCWKCVWLCMHENLEGLSSTTNLKSRGGETIPVHVPTHADMCF